MRDLTYEELNDELAEQLPSRELMSGCPPPPCRPSGGIKVVVVVAVWFGGHK